VTEANTRGWRVAELPLTRIAVNTEKQTSIRDAVGNAENLAGIAHVAREKDLDALTALLADPQISVPIYTLPSLINHDTIATFIDQHLDERKRGEGLLMVSIDENGVASAYHDIQFWPQWAACELGGAIRRDRQNTGQGGAGAGAAFDWLFDVIGVDLICETAAPDNVRTARLLERLGFTYKGEIESKLSGGGLRPSRYWELKKTDWSLRSTPTKSLAEPET
jgi:RimJ/RimL family protein N-acetyltransferase